jgi:acyl-CoA reductase-like NAD-dependent aldehyde dehydrogenase
MSPCDLVIPLLIDGKVDNGSGTFDVVSAKTGKPCWNAANASTEDAIRAVEAAGKAFPSWSKTKPAEKQRILFKVAELLESRISEYGEIMQMEMGGDKRPVQGWVLPNSVSYLRDIASHIPVMTGSVPTSGDEGTSAMIWKEPYGVILGISPW